MKLGSAFGIALAAVLVLALPSFAISACERTIGNGCFVPWVSAARQWLLALPFLAVVVTGGRVWRTRARLRELPGIRRAIYVVALVLVQACASLAGVAAAITSQRHVLFAPPPPYASLRSPDGRHTAYAVMDCFLDCALDVYVQDGHALVMHPVSHSAPVHDKNPRPKLVWDADSSKVQAAGVIAAPNPFDWGPH